MREENTHPCEEGKKSHNLKKNRFRDILPCKFSVVICFRVLKQITLILCMRTNSSTYFHHQLRDYRTERIISMNVIRLFDLILFVPSTIFHLYGIRSSWVESVLSYNKCVLLKDHNAVTPVRLEPAALRSRVKHSTTEPLRSLIKVIWPNCVQTYDLSIAVHKESGYLTCYRRLGRLVMQIGTGNKLFTPSTPQIETLLF